MRNDTSTSWLPILADPTGVRMPLPARPMTPRQLERLVERADLHGVLPAVVDHLSALAREQGPERIVTGAGQTSLDELLAPARQRLLDRATCCLLLRAQLREIIAAFISTGIPAIVLKGADVADRLYPSPHLRPFTDIDLLVPPGARHAAGENLTRLGYQPLAARMKHAEGYAECSFHRSGTPGGVVEIHWNLVNSPTLRRAVSVEYADLQWLPDENEDRHRQETSAPVPILWPHPSPAGLLLIAAVHGATGHQFDRLQLLCDVCLAVRGAAGEIDESYLAQTIDTTGAGRAMAMALHLAGTLLNEPKCHALAGRLHCPRPGLFSRMLLSPGVVLRGHARCDSFRRQLFRSMLKRKARP